MKILIADDEPLARARLRELIAEIGGYTLVGEAANGKETLLMTAESQVDIILMDIRMPGMDGMEAARHLSKLENPPAVIFTTAYDSHALAAFEAHAAGYLLKPIRKERLAAALAKAQQPNCLQLAALLVGRGEARARTHISALVHGNIQLVPIADVIYLKADQKYVTVQFATGHVLIEDSLKVLEEEFGARFLRIHRNALVACACLTGLEKNAAGHFTARLRGADKPLEVSRRHVATVRKRLKTG